MTVKSAATYKPTKLEVQAAWRVVRRVEREQLTGVPMYDRRILRMAAWDAGDNNPFVACRKWVVVHMAGAILGIRVPPNRTQWQDEPPTPRSQPLSPQQEQATAPRYPRRADYAYLSAVTAGHAIAHELSAFGGTVTAALSANEVRALRLAGYAVCRTPKRDRALVRDPVWGRRLANVEPGSAWEVRARLNVVPVEEVIRESKSAWAPPAYSVSVPMTEEIDEPTGPVTAAQAAWAMRQCQFRAADARSLARRNAARKWIASITREKAAE